MPAKDMKDYIAHIKIEPIDAIIFVLAILTVFISLRNDLESMHGALTATTLLVLLRLPFPIRYEEDDLVEV